MKGKAKALRRRTALVSTLALGLLLMAAPAHAIPEFGLGARPAPLPPAAQEVDIDEHLGGAVDRTLPFTDMNGRRVTLGDALGRGRPAVIVLAYYRCPMLCGLVLRGLVHAMEDAGLRLGDDYQAVTVSFDPRDTPEAASRKRKSTLAGLGRDSSDARAWPFLVGAEPAIHALADELGIRYAYDARTDQYAHPAAAIVLGPEGRVSRYLYGIDYKARDLRLALVEAGQGKTGTIVDRVLLTCYHYDPASRRYGPFVFGFIRIGGALILLVVVGMLVSLLLRGRGRAKAEGAAP